MNLKDHGRPIQRKEKALSLWQIYKGILIGAIALIFISFLIPELPESRKNVVEWLDDVRISNSGERLLVRTVQRDYEFELPPNHLNEAIASLGIPKPVQIGLEEGYLEDLTIDAAGNANVVFMLRYGGYGPQSTLDEKNRARLRELDFLPSSAPEAGNIDPPLYMNWTAKLSGQQHPAGSRPSFAGINLKPKTRTVVITFNDPNEFRRNRRINLILRPLVALRDGVKTSLFWTALLITGANPFPRG